MNSEEIQPLTIVGRAFLSQVLRYSVISAGIFSVLCPLAYFRGEFSWSLSILGEILLWSGSGVVFGFVGSLALIGTFCWFRSLSRLIFSGVPLIAGSINWSEWVRENRPLARIGEGFAALLLWVPLVLVVVAAVLVTGAA
ncbi:MAG: hypothetical protein RIA65_06240 [Woeseia sp.]